MTICRKIDEKTAPAKKLKAIEFTHIVNDETKKVITFDGSHTKPNEWGEIILLFTNREGFDVMLARDVAGQSKGWDCIFIGHWNDGIV